MRKILAVSTVLGVSIVAANAQVVDKTTTPFRVTEATPYTYMLPKIFPTAFAAWQKIVPQNLTSQGWLYTVSNATASPIRDVTVDGRPMKFGTVCKPHDCGQNIAGILFSPQQDRVGGAIHIDDNGTSIGTLTRTEYACIELFMDVHQSTTCVVK